MDYKIITPPARLPLDISDVQEFLSLDTQDDLETVNTFIQAATSFAQEYTGRTFLTTEYQMFYDCLPHSWVTDENFIELINGPIIDISELKVHNEDETSEVLTDWILTNDRMDGCIFPLSSNTWSTEKTLRNRKAVEITFTAGYGANRSDIPQGLINALLQIVAFLYENRQGEEVPSSLKKSLDMFRIMGL